MHFEKRRPQLGSVERDPWIWLSNREKKKKGKGKYEKSICYRLTLSHLIFFFAFHNLRMFSRCQTTREIKNYSIVYLHTLFVCLLPQLAHFEKVAPFSCKRATLCIAPYASPFCCHHDNRRRSLGFAIFGQTCGSGVWQKASACKDAWGGRSSNTPLCVCGAPTHHHTSTQIRIDNFKIRAAYQKLTPFDDP